MAISSSSLKLTTSGFLHLQNPFHHLPSTSQTTLTFSTKKILGPNPLAALTLTCAPTNIPTVGISQTFPTIGISQTFPTIGISQTVPTLGISETFTKLKSQGKVAFIPYITAGDPDLSTTAAALKVLDSCGSDIIELGLPHSDPLLDGPVIRDSAARSLARGTNFNKIISMLKEVVPQLSCPIVLFTYCNPVIKHGIEDFMFTISQAGVRGLVVPDVPFENTQGLRNEAAKNNIELVLLTTPTTPTGRMKDIVQASEGFVYLVSSVGVTGARARVNEQVPSLLREVKEATSKAVAVGFGLSKPEHLKQVAEWGADGVIVGSAIVKVLGEAKSPFEGLRQLETLAKSFKSALP